VKKQNVACHRALYTKRSVSKTLNPGSRSTAEIEQIAEERLETRRRV
jgi:hypothetical protein